MDNITNNYEALQLIVCQLSARGALVLFVRLPTCTHIDYQLHSRGVRKCHRHMYEAENLSPLADTYEWRKDSVQELKEYRRAGIRTFADTEVYEADKKRRSTVQPALTSALPGSLPRNWQYGMASADSSLQVGALQPLFAFNAGLECCPSTLGLL